MTKFSLTTTLLIMVLLNTPAFAELTVSDLEKIQAIVEKSETRLKEYINQEIEPIDTKFDGIEKQLASQNQTLEKHSDRLFGLLITLIAGLFTIIAAIGVPTISIAVMVSRQQKSTSPSLGLPYGYPSSNRLNKEVDRTV